MTRAQIEAGVAAYSGCVAELADGEGKGVAAALAAFLAARSGAGAARTGGGVHVAALDDYLAERDYWRYSPVFSMLGLTAGLTLPSLTGDRRREAYAGY